jgi:lipoprotein-anchoring transpeptidase ErfK/SrfK
MDRFNGRAVRRSEEYVGRRAQLRVLQHPVYNAAVRAMASAALLPLAALLALAAVSSLGRAQSSTGETKVSLAPRAIDATAIAASVQSTADSLARSAPPVPTFRSRADSVASVRTRLAADRDQDLRIVVSLNDRELWALIGPDTLLKAPVAVSTDETLEYAGKSWRFETPRGVRSVIAKKENPVWIPPEWHYAEVARENGLKLAPMTPGKTTLSDGRVLDVREKQVGVVDPVTKEFAYLPTDEEVIFDSTLFIPPIGTLNRQIEGELGQHMLDTGDGFLLHGTPHKASIGTAATHGCIRLRDEDIAWLYDMIPVGARVYIY